MLGDREIKNRKNILILIVVCLMPLLFTTTIPYALPTRLYLNSIKSTEHSWSYEIKLYVVSLEQGSDYTIDVDISPFWGMDITLRIAETPYMINGFSVNSGSTSGEAMHFTATKTGNYYIQIQVNSGSGFYDIVVESGTTSPATEITQNFFDISYLLVLILPCIFILAIGLLVLKKKASMVKKEPNINIYRRVDKKEQDITAEKEELMICEYCGSEIKKSLTRCPNCDTKLSKD